MNAESEAMIGATVLTPFIRCDYVRCSSCGSFVNRWDRFVGWLQSSTPSRVNLSFCAGGKPPTEQAGMMEAIMTGERESFNPCAGLTEPHLHVKCRVCGAGWLMRTKEAQR